MQPFSYSHGQGIFKADNLQPHTNTDIFDLQDSVDKLSQSITDLIDPSNGVFSREDYHKLPKKLRQDIKYAGNYLIAGVSTNGLRKQHHLSTCGIALLDLDEGNYKPHWLQEDLIQYQWVLWETITSTISKRKWRVAIPLAEPVPAHVYTDVYKEWVKSLPERLLKCLDLSQGRPGQPALLPVVWKAGPRTVVMNSGEFGNRLPLHSFMTKQLRERELLAPADRQFEHYAPPMEGVDRKRIEDVLAQMDPDPEEDWITVGRALHHQYQGDEEGLDIWMDWARGCREKFSEPVHRAKWQTFVDVPVNARPQTWHSVESRVGYRQAATASQEWEEKIDKATVKELWEDIADDILQDPRLNRDQRETLARKMRKCARKMGDDRSVEEWKHRVRQAVGKPLTASDNLSVPPGIDPDNPPLIQAGTGIIQQRKWWADEWVYLEQDNAFFSLKKRYHLSKDATNSVLNRHLHNTEGKLVMPAAKFLLEHLRIPNVFNRMYYPGRGTIVQWDGKDWVNEWDPRFLPTGWDKDQQDTAPPPLSQQQRDDVAFVLRHIHRLLQPQDALNFLRFWAWCIQNEGAKARWVPVIYSIQGTGKSLLGEVMRSTFGRRYATMVEGGEVLSTDGFNDWVAGHSFCVIEELRHEGESGFRIANKLKTIIANATIRVNDKNEKKREVLNTQNYVAFTNNYRPVSIESTHERRWFMCKSRFDKSQGDRMLAAIPQSYFDRLAALAEDDNAVLAMRQYLYHYDLKGWAPQGQAPKTEWYREVVESSNAGNAHGSLPIILNEEFPGNDPKRGYISTTLLNDHIREHGYDGEHKPEKVIGHTSALSQTLNELGYVKLDEGRFKIQSRMHTVYVRTQAGLRGQWLHTLRANGGEGTRKARVTRWFRRAIEEQLNGKKAKDLGEEFGEKDSDSDNVTPIK